MKKLYYLLLLVLCFTIFLPVLVLAQGGGGPIPPHVLPFGGIEYLLLAGVLLGIKKGLSKGRKN